MDDNQNMETTEISESEAISNYNFSLARKKMWELAIFFVIGWAIIAISFGYESSPLFIILGSAVLGFPSLKVIYRGGFRAAFNTDYYIVTTYADGHQETQYDFTGNLVFKILGVLIAVFLGVAITPIRMLLFMSKYRKYQKELGVAKPSLMESVWLPTLVMAAAFIIFIIVGVIIGNVQEYKRENVSEYSDEEIIAIIDAAEAELNAHEFSYSYNSKIAVKANIAITRTYNSGKATYKFVISETTSYDSETESDVALESKIPFGTYVYTDGVFDKEIADAEAKAFLVNLTLEKLVNFEQMRTNLDKCVVNNTYDIRYKYENDESYRVSLFEDDKRIYDISGHPLFGEDSSSVYNIKYN